MGHERGSARESATSAQGGADGGSGGAGACGDPGAAWDALCAALGRARRLAREQPEGYRYLARFLDAGLRVCVEYADTDHPEFVRMIERGMTWGLDCPDCLYLYAAVRGDACYRIQGTRGGAAHVDVQVNRGHFASGDIAAWGTIASRNDLDLEIGPDGSFELFVGGERRSGNWLPSAPDAEFVLVRQYFGDWERERPADLWIERVGAPASAAPAPSAEAMAARLARLCDWLEKAGALWERMSEALLALPPNTLNVVKPPDEDAKGGLAGQAYGMGNFRCGPGEAVVLEFVPPPCRHWSASLATWTWESVDYATRQSSLNGSQARLDADGAFRGVIARRDPGVPNWLDPAGHGEGSLAVRFLLADAAPQVRTRVVPLDGLREALPADTPRVSPAERAAQLRRRHRAVLGRYRR